MKRSCFFTLLLLGLSCQLSFGQLLRRDFLQEISLGVNGGLNFTKNSFLPNMNDHLYELGDQSLWKGSRFGFVFRYIHRSYFGIQAEANYVQAGWLEKFHEDSGVSMVNGFDMQDVTLSRRLEYWDFPILAHIYFGNRRLRFIVNLGPEIRCMKKYGDVKWNIPENDERKNAFNVIDPRFKNDYHKVDYGLTGGGGFDFQLAKWIHLLVECRYSFGFGDLYDNSKADLFQRSNNHMLGLMGSVMIPIVTFKENKAGDRVE